MADKLHTLTSNIIRFSAGEKPSADKFNAANEYFARSLRDISKAIGDIRDQGYPHVSDANKYTHLTGAWNPYEPNPEGRPLDIVNLARLIGPASNLNPKMLRFDKLVVETIPGSVMEYTLVYPYSGGTFVAGGGTVLTRVEADYFTGTNQFRVSNGIIYFSNTTPGGVNRSLVYETSSEGIFGGPNYEGASFNVIPDPNQPSKLSVVALANEVNAYSIDLGNCTHQQSGIKSKESLLLSSLNAGEFNNGVELKLPGWMWEGDLPRFENGDSIPEGFLVVKNLTTNEVYQNANYYFISPTEIHIKGVSLCVDHEFCVITVGTDITTSIDDLRNKLHLHKHDGSFGEGRVSVKSLIDKFSEYSSVVYGESSIPNNHFPMYLHRDGWFPDSNLNNGNNAMLGTLLMASVNFDSLNPVEYPVSTSLLNDSFDSTGYETRSIAFGNLDCYIKRRDDGTLRLKNSDYKSINVEAGIVNIESLEKTKVSSNTETNIIAPLVKIEAQQIQQSSVKNDIRINKNQEEDREERFIAYLANSGAGTENPQNNSSSYFLLNDEKASIRHESLIGIESNSIVIKDQIPGNVVASIDRSAIMYAASPFPASSVEVYINGNVNAPKEYRSFTESVFFTSEEIKHVNKSSEFILKHEIQDSVLSEFDDIKFSTGLYSRTEFLNKIQSELNSSIRDSWIANTLEEDSNGNIYLDATNYGLKILLMNDLNQTSLNYITDYSYENNSHTISLNIFNQNFSFKTEAYFDTGIRFEGGGTFFSKINDISVNIKLTESFSFVGDRDRRIFFEKAPNTNVIYNIDINMNNKSYLTTYIDQELLEEPFVNSNGEYIQGQEIRKIQYFNRTRFSLNGNCEYAIMDMKSFMNSKYKTVDITTLLNVDALSLPQDISHFVNLQALINV